MYSMEVSQTQSYSPKTSQMQTNKLNGAWTFWSHLPHDTNWSVDSYKEIYNMEYVEEALALVEGLSPRLVKNCMLFLMRKGIRPTWEDPSNANGGSFSYKVSNKSVFECWKQLSYALMGETLSKNELLQKSITGITISPKKNFCIVKIWLKDGKHQNAREITNIPHLAAEGCLFKLHKPEF